MMAAKRGILYANIRKEVVTLHSLWEETASLPAFDSLKGDAKVDVLIIGGGMAGVLTAHALHQRGIRYALVESGRIGGGVTGHTTAKLTAQHGLIYHKLLRTFGPEKARLYWQANEAALERYEHLCRDIPCDFTRQDSFVYTLEDRSALLEERNALREIGVAAELTEALPLPLSTAGAVKVANQGQFHPLKFLSALSQGLNLHENTPVRELADHTAYTDYGKITADKLIVATHFPFLNKHGSYFLKLYQHRSYVLALENAPPLSGMYVDDSGTGLSFRSYENLLLLGGGGHRTGKQGGNWTELRAFAKAHYPAAKEVAHWATQDCMTLDGAPYIGQYAGSTPDLYVATGFNKWGMTSSMVSATLLADLVEGKSNPYASLFSPSRTILRPQLAANAWEATISLLTPTAKRCPHLGCALKWNPAERTWDCPCHGSRFAQDGHLLDNPAPGGLQE